MGYSGEFVVDGVGLAEVEGFAFWVTGQPEVPSSCLKVVGSNDQGVHAVVAVEVSVCEQEAS